MSRRAWPRPIGDETYSARFARRRPRVHLRGAGRGAMKSRSSRLTGPGRARAGRCPAALETRRAVRPRVQRSRAADEGTGRTASSLPWMTSIGTVDPLAQRAHELLGSIRRGASMGQRQRLGVRFKAPADASSLCLVECGSVKTAKRRTRGSLGSARASSAGCTWPSPVDVERLAERRCIARAKCRPQRRGGRDEHGAGRRALGARRRAVRPSSRPPRERRPDGAVRGRCVHDGERVGGELVLVVGVDGGRAIRLAVAASVEGDDARVAGEVGDLRLPVARVDDRPGRQQQDGGVAGAVDLVEDADAVALDVAVLVRVARPRLLARRLDGAHGSSFS